MWSVAAAQQNMYVPAFVLGATHGVSLTGYLQQAVFAWGCAALLPLVVQSITLLVCPEPGRLD